MPFIYPKLTCPVPERLPEKLAVHPTDPFDTFERWFDSALEDIPEANSIFIASDSDNAPQNRTVYLRFWDRNGFVFFTNLHSKKGAELQDHPVSTWLFYWRESWRQVRISGKTAPVEDSLADEYFSQRPRESQISAWASLQSQVIENSDENGNGAFDKRLKSFTEKFEGVDVPRPPHWSGIRLTPQSFEFFQGRQSRRHDRWLYTLGQQHQWELVKLYP